jgi:hypothetical protein
MSNDICKTVVWGTELIRTRSARIQGKKKPGANAGQYRGKPYKSNLQPVCIRYLSSPGTQTSMQARPIQKLDVFCRHFEILSQKTLNFSGIKNVISFVVQFHDAAVFIGKFLRRGSQ